MPLTLPLRRRREKKTNYRKRLKLLLSGKPRLVIRRSNKYIRLQIVEYDEKGDRTILGLLSKILKKYGWPGSFKNLPACYLSGYLIGKLALRKNIKEVTADTGLHRLTKGCRIFAVIKGATDAGLKVPHSESIYPPEERIFGKHISSELEPLVYKVKESIDKEYGG